MKKQMRVLMVVPNLRVSNGVASYAMNYYRTLDHSRVQMDFVALSYRESPYLAEVEKEGSRVYVLPSVFRHPIKHIKKCSEILSKQSYDIIHDNILLQSLPIMWLSKKRVGVRILHSHNPKLGETRYKELLNSLFLPLLKLPANYNVACSDRAGKAMFGNNNYSIIPNVIDVDRFQYSEEIRNQTREKENANGFKIIGTVGRVAAQKNPFFAVDVIENVLEKRQDVEYWWIGSGPLDAQMKQYIEEKQLSDKIKMLGSRNDMPELYQAMDIFFLPSIFEGFGIACIEAEAAGLTCVVSDQVPQEVNVTGNVTFISLDQDVETWADTIISCIEKNTDRYLSNISCHESEYSVDNSKETLVDVYEACLAH